MTAKHIPVHVVSGFLGAGKTTLLNRVLKESHGRRFAVIVNEFGEIGIDGALIEGGSEDFVKMDNGCLCCALNADLMRTIEKLKERDDYDAVIVETTGIADPLPVMWTFFREAFAGCYRSGGIVTAVDALNFEAMNQAAPEVLLQIERADFLYVTKTARAEPGRRTALLELLPELNPNARVVSDEDPDAIALLFECGGDEKTLKDLGEEAGRHAHGNAYDSLSVPLAGLKAELGTIEDFFEALPKDVFRAKAVFDDAVSGKAFAMHAVCGRVEFYEAVAAGLTRAAVFIGKGFDAGEIEKNLKKVFIRK
jgi:G3E family GTPase